MRRVQISILVILLFGFSLITELLSNSAGPISGLSSAPGESTCIVCHNSFPLNSGNATVNISSNIPSNGYVPGERYTITAEIDDPDFNRFGFEMFVYGNQSGQGAGTVVQTDTIRTQLLEETRGTYIAHTLAGIDQDESTQWSFDWIAPAEGTDSIAVYGSFVVANNGNGNQQDFVYTRSLGVAEAAPASIRLWLEGFYDPISDQMRSDLADNNLLPTEQPFSLPPFNYQGTENITGNANAFVDWVLLELRDPQNTDNIILQQPALVDTNGIIRSVAGNSSFTFSGIAPGDYHLAVFHKSHLGVMSANSLFLGLGEPVSFDFTIANGQILGSEQLKPIGNTFVLHAGDFDGNGIVNNADFNLWKINSASLDLYLNVDVDGNGIINNQDYNLWRKNASKVGAISH